MVAGVFADSGDGILRPSGKAVSPDFALRAAAGKLLRLPPHSTPGHLWSAPAESRKGRRRRFGEVAPPSGKAVSPDFALRATAGKLLRLPPHSTPGECR